MATIGYDYVHNLMDAPSFVRGPIDVIDQDWLQQLTSRQLGISNKVLIDEVAHSTSADHSFGQSFLYYIRSLQVDWKHDAVRARFE